MEFTCILKEQYAMIKYDLFIPELGGYLSFKKAID